MRIDEQTHEPNHVDGANGSSTPCVVLRNEPNRTGHTHKCHNQTKPLTVPLRVQSSTDDETFHRVAMLLVFLCHCHDSLRSARDNIVVLRENSGMRQRAGKAL